MNPIFIFFLFSCFFLPKPHLLFAQEENASEEVLFDDTKKDPDMEALRKWIREKRLITLKETSGDLSISGNIRTQFCTINEKKNGVRQRGLNSATGKSSRPYSTIFNLLVDYRTDRTWSSVLLNYKNNMGIQDGSVSNIRLLRSYLGGRIVAQDTFTLDAAVGRRSLSDVFDSRIQFNNIFDGVLLRFSKAFEDLGDYYTNLAIFLVNTKRDYYAYAMEMGFLNVANTGLFFKASYIDWKKSQKSDAFDFQFDYRVSQLQAGYQYTSSWLKKLVKLYAATTYNDSADTITRIFSPQAMDTHANYQDQLDRIAVDPNGRYNWAWYAGVSVGKARKQGDWAIDTNYQWVQAQAIGDFDSSSGIGRGNAASVGTYTKMEGTQVVATTISESVGGGNYHGWTLRTLYAFSDNITISQQFDISTTLDKHIGPDLSYKQAKIQCTYTF